MDASLRELWRDAGLSRRLALIAVGGFGRGELYPQSDVDVLVLLPSGLPHRGERLVEEFISRLWDVGLELGHSVRTVEECREEAAKDVTVQTALFETRLIAGSLGLFQELLKPCMRTSIHRPFSTRSGSSKNSVTANTRTAPTAWNPI